MTFLSRDEVISVMRESWGIKWAFFMEMATPNGFSIEKSLHIRVKIDSQKPLRDSAQIKIRDGQICKILVKYERLR